MRIACSSWSLHREIPQSLSLLQFPAWCSSQGIVAIEVRDSQFPSLNSGFLTDFRRACDNAGVSIACMAIANDFTIPDADQLFAEVERTRQLLYDVALPLNIPLMRVCIGMADTTRDGDQRALETFRGLVTDLEATGMVMALENHSRIQTSPEQTAAIIAGVGTPLFGSCVDFGSLPPEQRENSWESLASLAKYVHARSCEFTPSGEESTIDYRRALAVLTEYGYDGDISIEYEGSGAPYQGVLQTKALIEKLWYYPAADMERKAA